MSNDVDPWIASALRVHPLARFAQRAAPGSRARVPSAFGPTLSSRLPPLATVSTSSATTRRARSGSRRRARCGSRRTNSRARGRPPTRPQADGAGTSYSNVTKSGLGAKKRSLNTTSKPRSGRVRTRLARRSGRRASDPGMAPMSVAPQHRGLEPLDQLADLRAHVRVDVALGVGILGMRPVEQRVVTAEEVTPLAYGVGELARPRRAWARVGPTLRSV